MTACISLARYTELSLPLRYSAAAGSYSPLRMLLVWMLPTCKFSQQQTAPRGEGEKSGSRHPAAHCDSALAGAVGWGLQSPGMSPTDTLSSVCAGDPGAWLRSSSACVLYSVFWQERQRTAEVFPLLGSYQQGASLMEGILCWKFNSQFPSIAWTEHGGWMGWEHMYRCTLNALNLDTTFTKLQHLTAAQEVFYVKLSTLLTYRKQGVSNSRFRLLNLAVPAQTMEI